MKKVTILASLFALGLFAQAADQVVTFSNKKGAFADNTARLVTYDATFGALAGQPVRSDAPTGSSYVAQLFVVNGAVSTPFGTPAAFRTSTSASFAGTWDAPAGGVTLTGIPQYTTVQLQVKVWDSTAGTYDQAVALGKGAGSSTVFSFTDAHSLPIAGAFDQSMVNLQAFSISQVPEPSTIALAGLGIAGLMVLRRK